MLSRSYVFARHQLRSDVAAIVLDALLVAMRIKVSKLILMLGFVAVICFTSTSWAQPGAMDYRRSGDDHFYNLDYDQAIADYTKLINQNPADPISYNDLASAQLYREVYRLGLLDSTAVTHDGRLLRDPYPQADPKAKQQVLETLERGRRSAESILAYEPHNTLALYSLCTNFGLLATYGFFLEKAWSSALRNGSRAQGYCDQAREVSPGFVDAYLVLGAYQYTVASLPLPARMLSALGGLHGSKKKGFEFVSRVAHEGQYDRTAARVLLTVLYRREKRPMEAVRVLEGLMADYPRNYIYPLELASAYSDAGQTERSLNVLKGVLERADQNAAGYRLLPRDAVQHRMQILEARLSGRHNPGS